MIGLQTLASNQLLACLPKEEMAHLCALLNLVKLSPGQSLIYSGAALQDVYFPLTGIVALHGLTLNGSKAILSLVGREGMVGVASFMGGSSITYNAKVLVGGQFLCMRSVDLVQAFEHSMPLLHLLLRYTQALITQMAQTLVCNRHHGLDKALSRFLLLCLDRATGDELLLTHQKIATLLGIRREGVREAAAQLQQLGMIRYARGRIKVLDRAALALCTCECYGVIKTEYDRLLPQQQAV